MNLSSLEIFACLEKDSLSAFSLISVCPLLPLPVMPRQDGMVAIVTGGGRGIGYEVVRHMARLGAHVIIGIVLSTSPLTYRQDRKYIPFNSTGPHFHKESNLLL